LQPHFKSTEDQNEVGECLVPDSTIVELKAKVKKWTEPGNIGHDLLGSNPRALKLCILDGFLLYSDSMSAIHNYMDIKYFLQVSYAKSKARREARSGYVLREGFWQDPPGYFDKIVWPNYVADHGWMFENGDVNGRMKKKDLRESRIEAQTDKDPDVDVETTLKWVVESLIKDLTNLVAE
jgi:nicotinamide/nicotinate riboside kinase